MNVKYRNNKIAAAVAGALAMAPMAFAHADVSFYGNVDVSVASLDYGQTGAKLALVEGAGSGGSRFGINASQDLGGGLTAKANIESYLFNINSAYASTFSVRQNWVGLSGGFGTINAGTDYDLTFLTIFGGEYCGWCGVSSFASLTTDTIRSSKYLKYMTPNMGGVSAGVGHVFGEDGASTETTDGDKTEAAVFYSGGPVNVAVSHRASNGSGAGSGEKMKETYASANFNFGIGKVYALVGAAKGSSGDTTDLQFAGAGVSFKLGGNDLVVQAGKVKDKETDDSDSTLMGVSYWHSIGKGTTVYAQYGKVSNDTGAARAPWVNTTGSTGFTQVAGEDFSGALVGLNLKF